MASWEIDSELMGHMLPCDTVTGNTRFTAVHDENRRPLLFSIGNDGHFYAIKNDGQGANVVIDLSVALNVSGKVKTFEVVQARDKTASLFIAFAVDRPTSLPAGASNVYVLRSIKPADLKPASPVFASILLEAAHQKDTAVEDLFMTAPATSTVQPLLVATYKNLGSTNTDVNIGRIQVDLAQGSWRWNEHVRIPETVKKVGAVSAGKLAVGDGIFALHGPMDDQRLAFTTVDPLNDSLWVTETFIPKGANINAIAPFVVNEKGHTDLLLVGDGLWTVSAKTAVGSGEEAQRLSTDPLYAGVKRLYVTQSASDISIWFENSGRTLAYQRGTNTSTATLSGPPVPLLPAGSSAEFAAVIDPSSKAQSLIVVGEGGSSTLRLLEQSPGTGLWNATPFLISAPSRVIEVDAFVSHIELKDADGLLRPLATVSATSPSWVPVLVNGVQRSLGPVASQLVTDAKGTLTIIQPSDVVSAYSYTLTNGAPVEKPGAGNGAVVTIDFLPTSGVVVDPTVKCQAKLAALGTPEALKAAKVDGKSLVPESASKEDIAGAAAALKQLHTAATELKSGGSSMSLKAMASQPMAAASIGVSVVATAGGGGIIQKVGDFFFWVREKIREATEWIVEKVQGAWRFVVKLAGQVYHFVLDSLKAIGNAFLFVLEKIGAAAKKVFEFLKFIFEWKDIKNTSDGIQLIVNSSLDFAVNFLQDKAAPVVEKWVDGLKEQLDTAMGLKLPAHVAEKQQDTKSNSKGKDDASSNKAAANTGVYHMDRAKEAKGNFGGVDTALSTLWKDVLKPILDSATKGAKDIAATLLKLFNSKKSASFGDIMKELGAEILHLIVTIIKQLVLGVIRLGADIVKGIKHVLNAPIEFPVIGPLLKKLGMPDFSLLDCVSIVVAIPVTILSKVISGKAPKRIQAFDAKAMAEHGKIDKESALAINELAGYCAITYTIIDVARKTISIWTADADFEPEPFKLAGFAFDILMQAISFPFDREDAGWEFRIAVWSVISIHLLVKAALQRAKVPGANKILAGVDATAAVAGFGISQAVHHHQIKKAGNNAEELALAGFDVGDSVFKLIGTMATTTGKLVPEPFTRTAASVIAAGAGACSAVIDSGKTTIAVGSGKKNYVSIGV